MSEISVLIADDEPAARRFVRRHLETLAPRVSIQGEVSNSYELVSSLAEHAPDILILDVMMPGLTGLDALKEAGPRSRSMKTIVVSAHDRFEFAQKALSLGVSEYLLKPVRPSELLATVNKCIEGVHEDRLVEKALERAGVRNVVGVGTARDTDLGTNPGTGPDVDAGAEPAATAYVSESNRLVAQAKVILESHMAEDITLSDVAKAVFISPSYLCRLFKAVCGVNLHEYLTRIRIQKARELLRNSDMSCSEIGRAVGYANPSHFSQAFKKMTGQSPSEFREHVNI